MLAIFSAFDSIFPSVLLDFIAKVRSASVTSYWPVSRRRFFAAESIAKEVIPRCMPAKNHPKNAVITIRYLPAFVRVSVGFWLGFDTVYLVMAEEDDAVSLRLVQQIGLASCI